MPWAPGNCGSGCPRAWRLPFPKATPSFPRSRNAPPPARPRRRAGARSGSSPWRCCRRRARSPACRFSWCGRKRPRTANRYRYECSWRLPCGRDVEVAPARRTGADENRVPAFRQQRLHAVDAFAAAEFHAEVEDVAAFLVDDGIGQTEFRNLRTDHAAGPWIAVEHHAMIADRGEVARDGERGGTAADQGN